MFINEKNGPSGYISFVSWFFNWTNRFLGSPSCPHVVLKTNRPNNLTSPTKTTCVLGVPEKSSYAYGVLEGKFYWFNYKWFCVTFGSRLYFLNSIFMYFISVHAMVPFYIFLILMHTHLHLVRLVREKIVFFFVFYFFSNALCQNEPRSLSLYIYVYMKQINMYIHVQICAHISFTIFPTLRNAALNILGQCSTAVFSEMISSVKTSGRKHRAPHSVYAM